MKRVRYVFPTSHHYRLPFHERLRTVLAPHDIDYRVVYSDPGEENRRKGDTVDIPWGIKVGRSTLPGGLIYQHSMGAALHCDLAIVQQESSLLLNYPLALASMAGARRVAYFGHGRNFQARDPNSRAERWKRFWATKADWWFGYTEETRRHLVSLGFPAARITVFNNAVDTGELRRLAATITPLRQEERRRELALVGQHVGIFVGGLYADKRLDFLIGAAAQVRAQIPDFELIVAGGGPDLDRLRTLAAPYPWIKVVGPRFGADKAELMSLAQLFLMPGLVGLAILDAGVMGLPTITTAFPWHSPEIAYLEPGVSGLSIAAWEDEEAYADAVTGLLLDPPRLAAMRAAARTMADSFTIEAMADRFADGVLKALA